MSTTMATSPGPMATPASPELLVVQDVSGRQSEPFTREQEVAEIATLTVDEIVSAEADLRGVTAGMGRLHVSSSSIMGASSHCVSGGGNHSVPPLHPLSGSHIKMPTKSDLLAMETALENIPLSQKLAYRQACLCCPSADDQHVGTGDVYSLSNAFKATFLEREGCNPTLAAKRYGAYWSTRLETFGSDRAFRPMTLSGALRDEVGDMVQYSVFQILPHTDRSGRAIIWFNLGQRRFDKLSEERESRVLFYLYHVLCADTSDPEIRRAGFILLGTSANVDRTKTSFRQQQFLGQLADVMPIRMRSGHICQPSPTFYYLIYPVLRMFMGKKWRLRTKIHYGNEEAILRELDTYGLPRTKVPTEIGGMLRLNLPRWVGEQSTKEKIMEARHYEERAKRDAEKDKKAKAEAERGRVSQASAAAGAKRQRQAIGDPNNDAEDKESSEEARARIVGTFTDELLCIGGRNHQKNGGAHSVLTSSSTIGEVDMSDDDILACMAKVCPKRESVGGMSVGTASSDNRKVGASGESGATVSEDVMNNLIECLDDEVMESFRDDCELLASDVANPSSFWARNA